MEDKETQKLIIDNNIMIRNHFEIKCICTKTLLAIRSEPKESWPYINISCKKMELTCHCGKVHTILSNGMVTTKEDVKK